MKCTRSKNIYGGVPRICQEWQMDYLWHNVFPDTELKVMKLKLSCQRCYKNEARWDDLIPDAPSQGKIPWFSPTPQFLIFWSTICQPLPIFPIRIYLNLLPNTHTQSVYCHPWASKLFFQTHGAPVFFLYTISKGPYYLRTGRKITVSF